MLFRGVREGSTLDPTCAVIAAWLWAFLSTCIYPHATHGFPFRATLIIPPKTHRKKLKYPSPTVMELIIY